MCKVSFLCLILWYGMWYYRCVRLGLTSIAYLWQRDQEELLTNMIDDGLNAIIIKVATIGQSLPSLPPSSSFLALFLSPSFSPSSLSHSETTFSSTPAGLRQTHLGQTLQEIKPHLKQLVRPHLLV